MPVDFETHDPGNTRVDLSEGTNARRLLAFLLQNQGVGYTPAELAEETDVNRGSVGPTLQRLEAVDLARHKKPYWAAPEDDRVAAATASFVGVDAVAADFSDDWYAQTEGWADELPDVRDEAE